MAWCTEEAVFYESWLRFFDSHDPINASVDKFQKSTNFAKHFLDTLLQGSGFKLSYTVRSTDTQLLHAVGISMNWRRRVSNANARCFKMSNGCGIPFQRLLNVPKCAMVGWQKWQIPKWPVQVPFHHRRSLSHRGPLMWITRIAALSMARITRIAALLMVASIQLLLQIAGVLCVTRSLIFHISPHVLIFLLFMFLMISSLHNASKAIVGSICRVGAVRGP